MDRAVPIDRLPKRAERKGKRRKSENVSIEDMADALFRYGYPVVGLRAVKAGRNGDRLTGPLRLVRVDSRRGSRVLQRAR